MNGLEDFASMSADIIREKYPDKADQPLDIPRSFAIEPLPPDDDHIYRTLLAILETLKEISHDIKSCIEDTASNTTRKGEN